MKKLASTQQQTFSRHVYSLDRFLTTVAAAMPVDVMPGAHLPPDLKGERAAPHRCPLHLFGNEPCMHPPCHSGDTDPTNFLLPQQPFHHCMLPQSSEQQTLHLCTNPYACSIDGVDFLGSSGQPLNDTMR